MRKWLFAIFAAVLTLALLTGCSAGSGGGAAESSGGSGGGERPADVAKDPDAPASSDPNAPVSSDGDAPKGGNGGASGGDGGGGDGGGVSGHPGSPGSSGGSAAGSPGDSGGEAEFPPAATADEASAAVIGALAARDMSALRAYAHPEKGVLFSPYAHIEADAVVFKPDELPEPDDATVREWGAYDGTGEPIELAFGDYYDKFVYDEDFASAEKIGKDEILGNGNTLVNIKDKFPNGTLVDYHFSGFDPQYDGMDWRSLILVLERHEDAWYVSAIVHSQWTI